MIELLGKVSHISRSLVINIEIRDKVGLGCPLIDFPIVLFHPSLATQKDNLELLHHFFDGLRTMMDCYIESCKVLTRKTAKS